MCIVTPVTQSLRVAVQLGIVRVCPNSAMHPPAGEYLRCSQVFALINNAHYSMLSC